tara:strand:- start:677 stop:1486 length:810 start_codon:yes stop_codon:yes gene_type:complete
MATVDLGKIKLKWRGTYAGGTAYTPDDVVYYVDGTVGSSYICIANTTGNAPSSGGSLHASWNYLAKGQNASPTTTQGDLIVRGASADQRLAIGTAGQALKVNASANGLEYGGVGNYSVHNIQGYQINAGTNTQYTGGRTDYIDIAQGNYMTFTITSTNDYIVFNWSIETYQSNFSHGIATYILYGTSTSLNSSSTKLRYPGQHSIYGDHYHLNLSSSSWVTGLSAGTYYFELAAASHANNSNRVDFGHTNTNQGLDGNHFVVGVHYKKE